jgi:hypothetical protein
MPSAIRFQAVHPLVSNSTVPKTKKAALIKTVIQNVRFSPFHIGARPTDPKTTASSGCATDASASEAP